jgi:putative transposase
MPRRPRICPAKTCFHVLNRAVARLPLFEKEADYDAFERVLRETLEREALPIYSFCLMPNHWHFVVRPKSNNQLSDFFRWLTHTHTMRWHAHHQTQGTGHLYQGRFKTFPIESDEHLLAVLRYVERNPVRANLCRHAEDWKHGSAWLMKSGKPDERAILSKWPIPRPRQWLKYVNEPQSESELAAVRRSVARGTPFGSEGWVTQTAARLQLKHTLRPRGRPKNQE